MKRESDRPKRGLNNLSNIEVIYVPPRKLAPKAEPQSLPSVIVSDKRPKTIPPTRSPITK